MSQTSIAFKRITIHCSVTPNGKFVDVATIREDHVNNRKFSDIGYHFLVQPNGMIQSGRPLKYNGAHVVGHNSRNLGVCLVGTDKFTEVQFRSLENLCRQLQLTYYINESEIHCHYEFDSAKLQGKTCPNIDRDDLLEWYRCPTDLAPIEKYLLKTDLTEPAKK